MNRQKQIFELIGRIKNKRKHKAYAGENKGQFYYKLEPVIENRAGIRQIFVFKETVGEKIWQEVEESGWIDRKYLFFCHKFSFVSGNYKLINWKEVNNSFSEKSKRSKKNGSDNTRTFNKSETKYGSH